VTLITNAIFKYGSRRKLDSNKLNYENQTKLIEAAQDSNNLARAQQAQEDLLIMNQDLIYKIANMCNAVNIDIDDLVQEGRMGFLKAIDSYKPNRGAKLSTYAYKIVLQYIWASISKNQLIPISPYIHKKNIGKENSEVLPRVYADLDKTFKDSNQTKLDSIKSTTEDPEVIYYMKSRKDVVKRSLQSLSKREREIIKCRFGFIHNEEHTLKEIGILFSLSATRIKQIIDESLNKLKIYFTKNDLIQFVK